MFGWRGTAATILTSLVLVGCAPPPLDETPGAMQRRVEAAAANMRNICLALAPEFVNSQERAFGYAQRIGADAWFSLDTVVIAHNTKTGQLDRASSAAEAHGCGALVELVNSAQFGTAMIDVMSEWGFELSEPRNDVMAVHGKRRSVIRYDVLEEDPPLALGFFDRSTARGITPAAFLVKLELQG